MSDTIIGRVDEMSNRIDDLEKSIQDLMVQVRFVAGSQCLIDDEPSIRQRAVLVQ